MSSPKAPLRIRNAADLFAGLRHDQLSVRLPTLAAVAAQPDLALAYGPHEGLDVVAELCAQLAGEPGLCGPAILGALVCFGDERVAVRCGELARQSQERELVALAVERLGREPGATAAALLELLWCDEPWRAQLAARAVASRPDVAPAERVRAELWGGGSHPDNVQPSSRLHWLNELQGPLRHRARRCLEAQGREAFLWLRHEVQEDWLWRWGAACFPLEVEPWLRSGLEGPQAGLVLELLEGQSGLAHLRSLAEPLRLHPDPDWRARAWRLSLRGPEPEVFRREQEPEVRVAMAEHWAGPEGPLELLVELAGDSDWRLRALAARGLVALEARDRARELALSSEVGQRTVGATVLVALEDYDWMEDHLLGAAN